MAPHSSTLAWKIPWMEEPGRLQSMRSLRVRQDSATSLSLLTFMHWRRKWQPTPVFLPRESQGQGSPGGLHRVGSHRVGRDWSNLAAAAFILRCYCCSVYTEFFGVLTEISQCYLIGIWTCRSQLQFFGISLHSICICPWWPHLLWWCQLISVCWWLLIIHPQYMLQTHIASYCLLINFTKMSHRHFKLNFSRTSFTVSHPKFWTYLFCFLLQL